MIDPAVLAFAGRFLSGGGGNSQGVGFGESLGNALSAAGQAGYLQQQRALEERQAALAETEQAIKLRAAFSALQQQQQVQEYARSQPAELQQLAAAFPELVARQQAAAAFADQGADPTNLMQNLAAAGLEPGSPQYQQAVLDAVTKRRQGETGNIKLPTGLSSSLTQATLLLACVPLKNGPADPTRPDDGTAEQDSASSREDGIGN